MKYCPNGECPHALAGGGCAEFEDRASTCHDCGMGLVAHEALATDETRAAVAAFHEARRRAVEARVAEGSAPMEDASPGRIDIIMGALILAACSLAIGTTIWRGVPEWTTAFVVRSFFALTSTIYGLSRLRNGLAARRAARHR